VKPYRTLATAAEAELPKVKGSRFLAYAAPAADDDAAAAHLEAVRRRHHAARHVCWARVLGPDGADARARDAGEPAGSAGRPILQAITGRGLTFVVVAVVRYFGGTKLGVGGLARAYGAAAAEALDRAEILRVVPSREVRADLAYTDLDIARAFARRRGASEASAEYGGRVQLSWLLPAEAADAFASGLLDASDGRIRPVVAPGLIDVGGPGTLAGGDRP